MSVSVAAAALLIIIGCFFIVVASIGLVRFPDFYTRIHPAGKSDTIGQALILGGLILYQGMSFESIKLLLIIIFICIANPTATHALAKAAHLAGLRPWQQSHGPAAPPSGEGQTRDETPQPD